MCCAGYTRIVVAYCLFAPPRETADWFFDVLSDVLAQVFFPDCQLGTMPPFGNLYGIPVLVDQALAEDEEISFNACCYTKVVKMKFGDYRKLVNPLVGHYAEPPFIREEAW